jgi:stage II sporulation protein AA (anti-sigma F factor antagonist)
MSLTIEKTGKATLVTLGGRLDSTNSAKVEADIVADTADDNVVLDVSGLDYISSAGLRVVLILAKRAKQADKRFILAGLQPHIRDVFDISGFLTILDTVDNRDTALAQL